MDGADEVALGFTGGGAGVSFRLLDRRARGSLPERPDEDPPGAAAPALMGRRGNCARNSLGSMIVRRLSGSLEGRGRKGGSGSGDSEGRKEGLEEAGGGVEAEKGGAC